MNTSVKQKKEFWPKFEAACRVQWEGGGNRYALGEDKEFTDLICEAVGTKFCGSQIMKHTGELINTNPKTEAGFFKIAVWAFIWWLKEKENLTQRDEGEEITKKDASLCIGCNQIMARGKDNPNCQVCANFSNE